MKHIASILTITLLLTSALLFALTWAHSATIATAASSAPMMSSPNYAMNWSAVGEISGGESASTNYKLRGTLGQMAANTDSASANYGACTGFECVLDALRVYLPLIMR